MRRAHTFNYIIRFKIIVSGYIKAIHDINSENNQESEMNCY